MEQKNECADMSVVTLSDLANKTRRAELMRKKQLILDKLNNTKLHIPQTLIEPSPATQKPCFPNASTSENVYDSIAYCKTLITVFEPSPGPSTSMMISNIPEALDFSSDDMDNDPDYVPLPEITNLQSIQLLHLSQFLMKTWNGMWGEKLSLKWPKSHIKEKERLIEVRWWSQLIIKIEC